MTCRYVDWEPLALKDFEKWRKENPKIAKKIIALINSAQENPFRGIGKSEPLKHNYAGCWSRRIDSEHRLVYSVTADAILIVSCRYHYEK